MKCTNFLKEKELYLVTRLHTGAGNQKMLPAEKHLQICPIHWNCIIYCQCQLLSDSLFLVFWFLTVPLCYSILCSKVCLVSVSMLKSCEGPLHPHVKSISINKGSKYIEPGQVHSNSYIFLQWRGEKRWDRFTLQVPVWIWHFINKITQNWRIIPLGFIWASVLYHKR